MLLGFLESRFVPVPSQVLMVGDAHSASASTGALEVAGSPPRPAPDVARPAPQPRAGWPPRGTPGMGVLHSRPDSRADPVDPI